MSKSLLRLVSGVIMAVCCGGVKNGA